MSWGVLAAALAALAGVLAGLLAPRVIGWLREPVLEAHGPPGRRCVSSRLRQGWRGGWRCSVPCRAQWWGGRWAGRRSSRAWTVPERRLPAARLCRCAHPTAAHPADRSVVRRIVACCCSPPRPTTASTGSGPRPGLARHGRLLLRHVAGRTARSRVRRRPAVGLAGTLPGLSGLGTAGDRALLRASCSAGSAVSCWCWPGGSASRHTCRSGRT